MVDLSALDAKELILLLVAGVGLVAVLAQHDERTKWFTYGYVMLAIGVFATNAEALVLGDLLNHVEHGVGIMGAGVVFCAAAYLRRRDVIEQGSTERADSAETGTRSEDAAAAGDSTAEGV